jgi:S-adenosylmethionine:tRNA ribosyltransferase-isomerase
MKIPDISIQQYDYQLPDERIRKIPLSDRSSAKLVTEENGTFQISSFKQLPELLNSNDLLVMNNSRVIPARVFFRKETGALIEIMCLAPYQLTYVQAFEARGNVQYTAYVGGAKKWKSGYLSQTIQINKEEVEVRVERIGQEKDAQIIAFSWESNHTFSEIIEHLGSIPLPPYFERLPSLEDKDRYQTVFADQQGSVAAPTAGLHYDSEVLMKLKEKSIPTSEVCLHVGAGTFKPVSSEKISEHEMHEEYFEVKVETVRSLLQCTGRVVSAGTTSLRTLESLYWLGVRCINGQEPNEVTQWEPYQQETEISAESALNALLDHCKVNRVDVVVAKSGICIVPGYRFRICRGLQTNFHQPKSTLILLVAAFIGEQWKELYSFSLKNELSFLSYGDTMLLWRK